VIEGKIIQEVSTFKYLGVRIDSKLGWSEQAQASNASAARWIMQFKRLTRPSTGVSPKLMRQLYLSVAIPKLTYGADIWYTPPYKPTGATNNSGSVGVLKTLQKTQRLATISIVGALRSTPSDLLDAHAGVLPMELLLRKSCHRALVRLLTLPRSHPLHKIIQKARSFPPSKHLSPIDQLLKIFRLHRKTIETIAPLTEICRNRFATEVPSSRKESIVSEAGDAADFKIFSDGSGHDGHIGAAAVIYKKGVRRPIGNIKAHLGPSTKHTTYEGEVVGGILAVWLARNTPGTVAKHISLYTDNQSFIAAIKNPKPAPGQYLTQEMQRLANAPLFNLKIKWISGHSKVVGNEEADKLAKEAAEGKASRRLDLPPLLQKELPISASAIKQEQHAKLMRRWRREWTVSPRRRRMEKLDMSFPFNDFRRRQYKLTRGQASTLFQIRSGHFPLNVYLHRINRSETKFCQQCEPEDGAQEETVDHFLFKCEAHAVCRRNLVRAIGRRHLNLPDIMANPKYMKAFTLYIAKTKRFATVVN